MGAKLLIVEDDQQYQILLKAALSSEHNLTIASSGKDALQILGKEEFDLLVVDWMLGDIEGIQICSYVKSQERLSATPIIMLTGKEGIDNLTLGFDSGADDYMVKPFHPKELQLRVRARLKSRKNVESGKIYLQGFFIDTKTQKAVIENTGQDLDLTPLEFRLLCYLSTHLDFVLSRDQILDKVWPNNLNVTPRTVDSHVSNLRKKLSSTSYNIEAVQGSGYRFTQVSSKMVA